MFKTQEKNVDLRHRVTQAPTSSRKQMQTTETANSERKSFHMLLIIWQFDKIISHVNHLAIL